ncbi:MAG: hypothetical protein AAF497_10595 [Planctomycetota bacterium]
MGSYIATWEDEENNRQIQFSVDYATENGSVEINDVTPVKVSFVCPETNTCTRTIRVHTDAGRKLLANNFRAKADLNLLATEIANRTQETIQA